MGALPAHVFLTLKSMSKKKYIAKSHVSLSVHIAPKSNVRVSFSPITGGSSVFYTDDEQLQKALKLHHEFGKLFSEDKTFEEKPVITTAAKKEDKRSAVSRIQVSCIDDAKDYLCDKFNYSRTALKSIASIKDAAETKGIEFIGI